MIYPDGTYRARRFVVDGPHGIEMSGHIDEPSFDFVLGGRTYAVGLEEARDLMLKLALVVDDLQRQGRTDPDDDSPCLSAVVVPFNVPTTRESK